MRIAQVVTYVSEDGSFGGPVAVAAMQCAALAALGHEVVLYAASDGIAELSSPGVTVRLFPGRRRGKAIGVLPPRLVREFLRRRGSFDVVHVHCGRDLVSAAAVVLLAGRSTLIAQCHGMVMPDRRSKARLFDKLVTRRALRRAHRVLALTEDERAGLEQVSRGGAHVGLVGNGIEVDEVPRRGNLTPEVLFLARLHPRKGVLTFAAAAMQLLDEGVDAEFRVVGPDEGDLSTLLAAIETHPRVRYEGAVPAVEARSRLRRADIYVLPSHGEVFPMTVLEAMAVGTATVLTTDCGLTPRLEEAGAVISAAPTPDAFAEAIRTLLMNSAVRGDLAARAQRFCRENLSSGAVATELQRVYVAT